MKGYLHYPKTGKGLDRSVLENERQVHWETMETYGHLLGVVILVIVLPHCFVKYDSLTLKLMSILMCITDASQTTLRPALHRRKPYGCLKMPYKDGL